MILQELLGCNRGFPQVCHGVVVLESIMSKREPAEWETTRYIIEAALREGDWASRSLKAAQAQSDG